MHLVACGTMPLRSNVRNGLDTYHIRVESDDFSVLDHVKYPHSAERSPGLSYAITFRTSLVTWVLPNLSSPMVIPLRPPEGVWMAIFTSFLKRFLYAFFRLLCYKGSKNSQISAFLVAIFIGSFKRLTIGSPDHNITLHAYPASTRHPTDVQWMFKRYVLWTCQNMF